MRLSQLSRVSLFKDGEDKAIMEMAPRNHSAAAGGEDRFSLQSYAKGGAESQVKREEAANSAEKNEEMLFMYDPDGALKTNDVSPGDQNYEPQIQKKQVEKVNVYELFNSLNKIDRQRIEQNCEQALIESLKDGEFSFKVVG